MQPTTDQVLAALRHVEEPDLKQDLVTLGMVQDIVCAEGQVTFTVVLTTPACPLKELIRKRCVDAIATHIDPAIKVTVNLTANVTSGRGPTGPLLPGVKNIVAISSGKGGVGKSTVTANLALALAKSGASVGLIDADISGPSVPVMFGAEGDHPTVQQIDGKNWLIPIMRYGVKLLSIGFLAPAENAVVWRGPMMSSALRQFISDTLWGDLDYLLIDLPPGTSDIHLTLVQTVPVTGAIIVTTPQKVALADAEKGLNMFRMPQINVPVLGVVENMAWFTPAELPDNKYYIFGQGGGALLAEAHNIPLLGQIPLVQSIRESADAGAPIVLHEDDPAAAAFSDLAESVARQVAIRNAALTQTQTVKIVA
jgi:ATP-binding protein involved in chromosome partitioning